MTSHAAEPRAARRRGLGLTAAAVVGSGVLVNLLLAVVARSVQPDAYALFSAFWAVSLVVGFGVFLPVEQLLAGRRPDDSVLGAELWSVGRVVVVLVAAEVVVVVILGALFLRPLGAGPGFLAALVVLCAVSGIQFLARGALLAGDRLGVFSGVLLLDVGLRVVLTLGLSLAGASGATPYAWAIVVAMAVAHVPVVVVVLRRRRSVCPPPSWDRRPRPAGAGSGGPARPLLLLLIGSLGAQLLFNGPTIALAATASTEDLSEVAAFQAAFQVVRIPLFLAIPAQAALVPVLSGVLAGRTHQARALLLGRYLLGVAALMGLGAALGRTVGPSLLTIVVGDQYLTDGGQMAVLSAGVGSYLGLLVLTQTFVADHRHLVVGLSWAAAVASAALVFLVAPRFASITDVDASAISFTTGSVIGLAGASAAAWRGVRTVHTS